MSRRTGFWFQLARGRALVRTARMKEARRAHRALVALRAGEWDTERAAAVLRTPLSRDLRSVCPADRLRAFVAEMLEKDIRWAVEDARIANRRHREYRRRHEAEMASEAALRAFD